MSNDELTASMSALIRRHLGTGREPVLVAGALHGGRRLVVSHGALPGPHPPALLLFELGSVTKLFTAVLLARLVTEGRLRLEDPALEPPTQRPLTLLGLATHTSGLPRLPTNLVLHGAPPDNPYAPYAVADLQRFLAEHSLKRRHVGRFKYSNLGMGVLGHCLQQRLGLSYEEAVLEHICRPLGMDDTCQTPGPGQRGRLVQGHTSRRRPVPPWDNPTLAGAGCLFSTTQDMLRFLEANLGEAPSPLREALRLCHEPRVRGPRRGGVGLGWMMGPSHGELLLWHNGATSGTNTFVGLNSARRVAVTVFIDQGPSVLSTLGLWPDPATRLGVKLLELLVKEQTSA